MAGLWYGGGKGVIARQPGSQWTDAAFRKALYREYGSFVTSLQGA
jgi:glutamate dehydrogenase (NAD(P)+)